MSDRLSITHGDSGSVVAEPGGNAYHLNGQHAYAGGNHLAMSRDDTLFGQDRVSFAMAFKAETAGSGGVLFRMHTALEIAVTDGGDIVFELLSNSVGESGVIVSTGLNVADAGWHHLAFSYDAHAGAMVGYVDGRAVGEIAVSAPTQIAQSWDPTIGDPWGKGFVGSVDEIAIVDKAISGTEALDLSATTLAKIEPSHPPPSAAAAAAEPAHSSAEPATLFELDFGGGELGDGSANGIRVAHGSPDAIVDGAYLLDGLKGGNYIALERDGSLFGREQLTVSLDFKSAEDGVGGGLFRMHTGLRIEVTADGQAVFTLDENAAGESGVIKSGPLGLADTAWHHVDLVYDAEAGVMTGLVDGVAVGEIPVGAPLKQAEHWDPMIGEPWGKGFVGYVDNIEISDRGTEDLDGTADSMPPSPQFTESEVFDWFGNQAKFAEPTGDGEAHVTSADARTVPAESSENYVRVATADDLENALGTLSGGETVLLQAGDYGSLDLTRLRFTDTVTFVSEDPDSPARFDSINIVQSSNLTLRNVAVKMEPDEDTMSFASAVRIISSSEISVVNSVVAGGPAVNGVPPETEPGGLDATGNVLGLPAGRAFSVQDAQAIRIEDNKISEFHSGVNLHNVDGISVSGNEIADLRTTPLRGGNVDHVVVNGNYFHDSTPWNFGGSGDHGDHIHFWTVVGAQDGPSTSIEISGNFFFQGGGEALLGIYLDDNANALGFTDVVIEDNIFHNGDSQQIRFENVSEAVVANNTLLQSGGGRNDAPGIVLTQGTETVEIRNNILGHLTKLDVVEGTIVEENNLFVQRFDPDAPNHYSDLFVNALAENPQLADLQALPDGAIAAMGVGANATTFDPNPETLTALIRTQRAEDSDFSFTFDGSLSADARGAVSASDAEFFWTFGDGATAQGAVVTHTFDAPGDYQVELTVVHADGSVDINRSEAAVADPQLLNIGFSSDGVRELSSYQAAIGGDAQRESIVEGRSAYAYHLTDANSFEVREQDAPQIFGLDAFSLSFALKRDAVDEGGGDLARIHGAWRFGLDDAGELTFDFNNADGESFGLATQGAGLTNQDWHAVTLTYDSAAGEAIFYVDGEDVGGGSVSGRTPDMSHWGFSIGNPFGTNFNGLIESVELRGTALSPSQVADWHKDFMSDQPAPFDVGYRFGFDDENSGEPSIEFMGGAHVSATSAGSVATLDGDGDHLRLGRLEDVAQDKQLSIGLDFRLDDGADDGPVRLLWNHMKYGVELTGDELRVRVGTSDGDMARIPSGTVEFRDSDWHHVGLSLDEDSGLVRLYVDGRPVIDEVVETLSFTGEARWDATAGGTAWGNGLDGQVDNVTFVQQVLDGAEFLTLSSHVMPSAEEPRFGFLSQDEAHFSWNAGDGPTGADLADQRAHTAADRNDATATAHGDGSRAEILDFDDGLIAFHPWDMDQPPLA